MFIPCCLEIPLGYLICSLRTLRGNSCVTTKNPRKTRVKMFETDQRRLFSQFEVREFCDNLVEGVVKPLKDVSQIHKKSTSTRAPVAEPSLFISETSKGKSENNLEDLKESDLVFDDEETNGLTCFEPEHPSSLILSSRDFEEEPLDYPHQRPSLDLTLGDPWTMA
ncbi:hypothetical protein DY000_02061391 [Brassica cretica]|uniref:Uncharacterized protein n=1 Tax=Brassica cretica TaxID=69181 RepID=A0ABQ7AR46_BRACR|nr:hypothetical protein DY000_02061391 [Brassica cretica]